MLIPPGVGGLDVEVIRQAVDRVLADELYWFPVRHHSPTVARHLQTDPGHALPVPPFGAGQ